MSPSDLEPDIDPQGLWQSQKKEYDPMTLAQIHAKAVSFERTVRRRNKIEYVSYGLAIAISLAVAVITPKITTLIRIGIAITILGMAFVAWQLHRRASAEATPPVGESLVEAYRRQLIRQRDAGSTGFWWYILPMIPGPVVMIVGLWLKGPLAGQPVLRLYLPTLLLAVMMVLGFGWCMFLIRAGVRSLQKRIDEL